MSMVMLVVVSNLLGNLDQALFSLAGFRQFIDRIVGALPLTLDVAIPLTVLLATLFTFNSLGRSSELVAMRAAGMGIGRQLRPILAVLVFISALDYVNQNYLYSLLAQPSKKQAAHQGEPQWAVLGDRIFYASQVDSKRGRLSDVRIFRWADQPFHLRELNHVAHVTRSDDQRWIHEETNIRRTDAGGWRHIRQGRQEHPSESLPDIFRVEESDPHFLPVFDLYLKIRQLESQGGAIELFRLEWYQKFAATAAPFVLVWFGMPLSQAYFRKGQASGEIIIGLLGGLFFLVATEIVFTLGKGGFLPPILSAWLVNLVYLGLGGILLWRTH